MSTAIVKAEPLKISGSHADREARAQALANKAVGAVRQFVTGHIDEIVQVRQDFWDIRKDPGKLICGVHGFEEYCDGVMHFSASYIRSLIPPGKNPASKTHDGSANRESKPSAEASREPIMMRKNSDGTTSVIPSAEYTAGDALGAARKFIASLASHLTPQDADTFYRSLCLHIEDILNKVQAA
jgi:hypothetical protein